MKLLGSTEIKITKDKNGENVMHLGVTEIVVIVHCNIVNNDYQQDSRVLHTFVPNKPFRSLLEISPTIDIFLKSIKKNQSTDQNSQPLAIENRINLTLAIKWRI